MRSFSSVFVAIAIVSVAASNAAAQQTIQLESGARVRLFSPTLPADQRVGRIISTGNDTVVFRSERYPVTRSLALAEITAVDLSLGERRRTRRGAVIGLLSGVAIGGIAGYTTHEKPEPCTSFVCIEPSSAGSLAAVGGLMGGVLGLLAGTTIGWLSKSEKWQRVHPNARVGFAPSRRGGAVSISHAF